MDLKFIKVESSNIDRVAYKDNKLYVEYKSGGLYAYDWVPEDVWNNLLNSESKGRFMNSIIKENYKYDKVDSKKSLQSE